MVVDPPTSKVPAMSVLPLEPVTWNLSVLTIIEPPIVAVAVVVMLETFRTANVVLPVTSRVPTISVLPVAPLIVTFVAALAPTKISDPTYKSV